MTDEYESPAMTLLTKVSEKLPEDELLNLINDLKAKRNEYLGE